MIAPNWWSRWRRRKHLGKGHTQRTRVLPEVGGIQGFATKCSCSKDWLEVY